MRIVDLSLTVEECDSAPVTASDTLSGVSSIALLVGKPRADDDERDTSHMRRFWVGPGEAAPKATDAAGNVGTAVCSLPPRHARHDDGRGDDSEKGRVSTRSNRRVESDR